MERRNKLYFLCHLWNHTADGKRSLEDVIGIIGHALRSLGHEIVWDPTNENCEKPIKFYTSPDSYNIIVEGFTPWVMGLISEAHAAGARFICIATEEPTDKGFNHGTQKEMVWRQELFPKAAQYLDGIMHLVPGKPVTDWYGQFAPSAYVELGYAPTLVRAQKIREPEFDFGFFGSLSPRRLALLRKLAQFVGSKKAVRIVADFATQDARDFAMQNAKIVLQVRKFDEMGLVSSSRCNTALNNGRPIIAEPHDAELSHPWDKIVKFTDSESHFFATCRMARAGWRTMHAEQFARFKEMLPPQVSVGNALDYILSAAQQKRLGGV